MDDERLELLTIPKKYLPKRQKHSSEGFMAYKFYFFMILKAVFAGIAGDQQAALFGQCAQTWTFITC